MIAVVTITSLAIAEQTGVEKNQERVVYKKLKEIKIPEINFQNAAIEDVVKFISVKTREGDPTGDEINFILKTGPKTPTTVNLSLKNVSVQEALQYLSFGANVKYRAKGNAVIIVPQNEDFEPRITRTFDLPAAFFSSEELKKSVASGASSSQCDVKKALCDMGVQFLGDASAVFIPDSNKLVLKNTPEQMDVIEELIKSRMQK